MGRGLAAALGITALLVVSCGPQLRQCSDGCVNGAVCHEKTQLCVYPRDSGSAGGSGGGGSTAGGVAGGGNAGGTVSCQPPCPDSMECAGANCRSRYAGLSIVAPNRTGRAGAMVWADLAVAAGRQRRDPPTLQLALDGGVLLNDAGTAVTALMLVDAGLYQAYVYLPGMSGARELLAIFPDAGLGATAVTTVDFSPPVAEVSLSAPPARIVTIDGGVVQADPAAPAAYRRDESVTVTLDFADSDVSAIELEMLSDGGGIQPLGSPDAGCASRFDGGVCRRQRVDLWRHPMNAFHDLVRLRAQVIDDLGNAQLLDAGAVTVTRFKWSRQMPITLRPGALTRQGLLIVTGAYATHAIQPDGIDRWTIPDWGGAVAVGGQADERIYIGASGSGQLYGSAHNSTTPNAMAFRPLFDGGAALPLGFFAGPAIVSLGGDEVVYFGNTEMDLHAWRRSDQRTAHLDGGSVFFFGPLAPISDNTRVFRTLMDAPAFVAVASFGADGFAPQHQPSLSIVGSVSSAAIAQLDLVYLGVTVGTSGLIVPISRNAVLTPSIPVPAGSPQIAIGANTLFVNGLAPTSPLCRLPLGSSTTTCAVHGSYGHAIVGSGVSGGPPILYVTAYDDPNLSEGPRVLAIESSTLALLWRTPLPATQMAYTLVSVDCGRQANGSPIPGTPGVLYAIRNFPETIHAFVVDSPGIDGTARWPMQTHDPRNTNNSATSLSDFYCP